MLINDCEVHFVIRFLNAKNISPDEIHQLVQVCGEGIKNKEKCINGIHF